MTIVEVSGIPPAISRCDGRLNCGRLAHEGRAIRGRLHGVVRCGIGRTMPLRSVFEVQVHGLLRILPGRPHLLLFLHLFGRQHVS